MKKCLAVMIILSVLLTACANSNTQINDQETVETMTQLETQAAVEQSEFEEIATTAQITTETTEESTTEVVIEEPTEATTSESTTEEVVTSSEPVVALLPDIYDYLEYDAIYLQNYLTDCGATNVYLTDSGVMAEFPNWSLLIQYYSGGVQQFTVYSSSSDEEYLLEANYSDGILVISGYEYRVAAEILYVLPRLVQDIIEKQPTGEFVFNTDNLATVSPQN